MDNLTERAPFTPVCSFLRGWYEDQHFVSRVNGCPQIDTVAVGGIYTSLAVETRDAVFASGVDYNPDAQVATVQHGNNALYHTDRLMEVAQSGRQLTGINNALYNISHLQAGVYHVKLSQGGQTVMMPYNAG